MCNAEARARDMLKKASMETLLNQWELTSVTNDENIPTVRGWLMDEFSAREPEAFDAWLDGDAEDETLREYMM